VSTSLVYRSAVGYELVMRALYGRHYADRLRAVADEVPKGSSVVELCCGPGKLYLRFLRGRVSTYVGLDVNPRFVIQLRRQGVDARLMDLNRMEDPLPPADVAVMQASLYHFLPSAAVIVDRMLAAASDRVIISEPVRNLASSHNPFIRALAQPTRGPGALSAASETKRWML
jgi:SAM-dependent methyltransferase